MAKEKRKSREELLKLKAKIDQYRVQNQSSLEKACQEFGWSRQAYYIFTAKLKREAKQESAPQEVSKKRAPYKRRQPVDGALMKDSKDVKILIGNADSIHSIMTRLGY